MAKLHLVNARTAEQWAEVIRGKWQDNVAGIFDVGLLLHNSREELGAAAFWVMVRDDLKYGKRTAQRLIAVGTDARLMDATHVSLPASWGTLYALTRLTDEQFQRGLDTGVIHAGMERKDIATLKPPKDAPKKAKPRSSAPLPIDHPIQEFATLMRTSIFGWLNDLPFDDWPLLFSRVREELDDIEREAPATEAEMREEGKSA